MKSFYLKLFVLLFLVGCLPNAKKKSVLEFLERSPASSPSTIANLEQSGLNVRMGDRYYASSLLLDVFGPDANEVIKNNIMTKMDNFGGGCDQYDKSATGVCSADDCSIVNCTGAEVIHNQIGVSSVIRQGWTRKACEEISNKDSAILYAIQRITGLNNLTIQNTPVPSNQNLIKAYTLFYRSVAPNSAVTTSLVAISNSETTNHFEKWRYVLLSLCTTPEWQIP
jgi:hypothetical protein